jgi:hypothetical protein
MNIILLHTNHSFGSATHVAIFRVVQQEYSCNYNMSETIQISKII